MSAARRPARNTAPRGSGQAVQGLCEVGNQIRRVLEPDRRPYQSLPYAHLVALGLTHAPVGGGGRMSNDAFGVTDVGGDGEIFQCIDYLPGGSPVAHLETDDATEVLLLTTRQGMLWVTGQPRIMHAPHLVMSVQPVGDPGGALTLTLHADG